MLPMWPQQWETSDKATAGFLNSQLQTVLETRVRLTGRLVPTASIEPCMPVSSSPERDPIPCPVYTEPLPTLLYLIPLPSPFLHFKDLRYPMSFLIYPRFFCHWNNNSLPNHDPRVVKDQQILLRFLMEEDTPQNWEQKYSFSYSTSRKARIIWC